MCCVYISNKWIISCQLSLCRTTATDSTLVWLGVPMLVGKVIKTCCFGGYVVRDHFRRVFQARSRRAAYTSLWIPRVLLYHQHSITAWDYPSAITPDSTARFFRLTFWNRLPMVTIQCILCILCKRIESDKTTSIYNVSTRVLSKK